MNHLKEVADLEDVRRLTRQWMVKVKIPNSLEGSVNYLDFRVGEQDLEYHNDDDYWTWKDQRTDPTIPNHIELYGFLNNYIMQDRSIADKIIFSKHDLADIEIVDVTLLRESTSRNKRNLLVSCKTIKETNMHRARRLARRPVNDRRSRRTDTRNLISGVRQLVEENSLPDKHQSYQVKLVGTTQGGVTRTFHLSVIATDEGMAKSKALAISSSMGYDSVSVDGITMSPDSTQKRHQLGSMQNWRTDQSPSPQTGTTPDPVI